MRFVAFFRAVNFGHRGSPAKTEFISAFVAAGAADAASLQSHGNGVFSARDEHEAAAIADDVLDRLRDACGTRGPVYVRSLRYLADLVESNPFAAAPQDDVYERCVTFLPGEVADALDLPVRTSRSDVEVFRISPLEAFSVTRLVGRSPGNVNGLLERLLQTQATSRNWNTICRLVQRFGSPDA